MKTRTKETLEINDEQALISLRNTIRDRANSVGFGTLEQTKLITAASELARNMLLYAGSGNIILEQVAVNGRTGLKLTFQDQGPGIANIEQAMESGYTSGTGLGLGLPGAKRLVNEFEIKSKPGSGTVVKIILWKHER
ncbi:MAG TPA: anti-sigma regulatory factor [Adhaeribacter sp.]|nr:anti-sigma regulatory factor [Adhaeribacter sp.]